MIREEAGAGGPAPASSRPGTRPGDGGRAQPAQSTADVRAIAAVPVVADSTARAAQAAQDPDLAYGPDDPGYGPPGPDWYRRNPEEPVVAEPAITPVVADVTPAVAVTVRSPFEPLPRHGTASRSPEIGQAPEYEPAEYAERGEDGASSYPAAGDNNPGIADVDLAGSEDDDTLGQLRYLYVSAERMGAETTGADGTDSQLGQLLERQRKLISEYFKESGAP